ncbi:MAG TPA: type IV secretion system DNA-binding domain-containing protein [Patescibacteria group bacterium]|nr:type IV secretion system DNA-binding domain-containing protein [Patescibacteria group bacterium]
MSEKNNDNLSKINSTQKNGVDNLSRIKKENTDDVCLFAKTNFRNQHKKFGIRTDDRRRHMYLVGKTGTGKTTTIENMIYQDIQAGKGVAVVDPHGDLAEKMINCIPSERINETLYFNPADTEFPIAFNILEKVDSKRRHLVASGLVGVFKKIWADSWGPRLEYVLRNTILSLLEYPDSTLLGIMRMLVDKDFRSKVVDNLTDPVVRSFWVEEYNRYHDRLRTEAIAPIQNKVGQFLSTSLIRNIVGQVRSKFNIREVMDQEKILIMNLSKGRIGEDASSLLGAMMITKIQLAAMSRMDMKEEDRKDFYLYVDEFQNFATESFASILSEARKYHLNLTLAHQYIGQLITDQSDRVRNAVFGNVGTMVVFRVGAEDAEFLSREFAPRFTEDDLVDLDKYNVYVKLMIDGVTSDPFSAITLPPISEPENNEEKIIRASRERYAEPKEVVEDKIARWSGLIKKGQDLNDLKNKKDKHKAICSECGKTTYVPFVPDGLRPVYCKDCLKKKKKEKDLKDNSQKETKDSLPKKSDNNS